MREYKIDELALFLGSLATVSRDLGTSDNLKQPICTDKFLEKLAWVMEAVAILCEGFEADPSLRSQVEKLRSELKEHAVDRREAVLQARIDAIIEGIENNLTSRKFMFIPPDEASYWNNTEIFGHYFVLKVPEKAILEMLQAGKCFAAGLGTACAFHCMRVAEYGLRKLARSLKVTITHKDRTVLLEYGDWNKVITAIRNKIADIRKNPVGPKRERQLQFYSEAADHCEYMKDIWRNELAHTRRFYNKQEALGVISRVRDFFQLFPMNDKNAAKELEKRFRRIPELRRDDEKPDRGPIRGDKS